LPIADEYDHETYRVIILTPDAAETFVTRSGAGLCFPQFSIPQKQRVTHSVATNMKQRWGEEAVCLFELNSRFVSANSRYIIARHWQRFGQSGLSLEQISVTDLREDSFAETTDYLAMRESVDQCRLMLPDPMTGPFVRPDWFDELYEWVGQAILSRGLHLTGSFQQMSACPTSSLIRFETNGPAVWFKAAGEPNQHEFRITLKLMELFPNFLPKTIAARPDWNGWLSFEAEGTNLAETQEFTQWEMTASALAKLQVESMTKVDAIAASGARDLSIKTLGALVAPFFGVMAQLMMGQTKEPPAILNRTELLHVADVIRKSLVQLQDAAVPDALGHSDLNPGNIVAARDQCRFLDWAEAYVGNPVFSFQYLLEHLRHWTVADRDAEGTLITAYVELLRKRVSDAALEDVLLLTPLVGLFAYAVCDQAWTDRHRLKHPGTAGYFRSLTRRMSREANSLSIRRSLCLS